MNELKKGDTIWLPYYDELIKKFGETIIDGKTVLKTKPLWDTRLRMKTMCGLYHTVTKVNHDSIVIAHPSGTTYSFAKEIFEENKKKDIPIYRNKTININNILFRQMRHRYDFVEYEHVLPSQKGFGIIDSIYPNELWKKESGRLPSTMRAGTVAISEKIAKDLGVPQLHISELVGFFGYTKTNITKLLLSVKKKKFNILVIGFGGTGTNFIHWMSKMVEWTNIHHAFNDMIVADNDYFDSTNLLRVPFILPEIKSKSIEKKTKYFIDYARISKSTFKQTALVKKENLMKDYIHYGAPDLETREMLNKEKVPFIAATHRDNACALMLRPEMDTDLMVETYGKIALTPFFMNHIRMTIAFLEYLSHKDTTIESMRGEEKSIFNFDFAEAHKDEITNGTRIGNRTVYPIIAKTTNTVEINVGE